MSVASDADPKRSCSCGCSFSYSRSAESVNCLGVKPRGTLPVTSVEHEEDYERISEAVWGVANAFTGSSLYAGHELVACPECGYEGSVDQSVFPAGIEHSTDE